MGVPTIVSVYPASNATGIPSRVLLTVVFSESIKRSSIKDGTVVLTDLDSMEAVPLSFKLLNTNTELEILPRYELRASTTYNLFISGADSDVPAGTIESDTNDPLAISNNCNFQTGIERFVSLEEVTDRDDIDHIAPIREESELSRVTNLISILASSPEGFSCNNASLDEITVTFSEDIDQTAWFDEYFSLEMFPILDLTRYLGNYNEDGERKLYLQDATVPIALPTGTISISGATITWTRDTTIPPGEHPYYNTFPFNAEVIATLDARIQGASSQRPLLGQDVKIAFSTELYPTYSGPRTLRLDVGPILDDYFDDTLCRLVLKRSIEAWELNGMCFDIDNPPHMAREFVRWGSVLDALEVVSAKLDLVRGTAKQLGDFRVDFSNRGFTKDTGRFLTARNALDKAEYALRQTRCSMRPRTAAIGSTALNSQVVFRGVRNWDTYLKVTNSATPIANHYRHRQISKLIDQGASGFAYLSPQTYRDGYVYLYNL